MKTTKYKSDDYGGTVKKYLHCRNMRQTDLAKKIGISRVTLWRYLEDVNVMPIGIARLIQNILAIPANEWEF